MKLIFWWYHFPIEKRLSDEFQTASFRSLQFSYFPRIRGSPEAAAKDSLACLVFVVCHSRLQDAAEYACSDGTSTAVDDTERAASICFFALFETEPEPPGGRRRRRECAAFDRNRVGWSSALFSDRRLSFARGEGRGGRRLPVVESPCSAIRRMERPLCRGR